MDRCQFVQNHQRRIGVKRLCDILGLSRSSFYHWRRTAPQQGRLGRPPRPSSRARIRTVHQESDGTYGAPRITAVLHDQGERINRKRVARVMRTIGLEVVRLRRRPTPNHCPGPDRSQGPRADRSGLHRDAGEHKVRRRHHIPAGQRREAALSRDRHPLASRRLTGWAIADHMRTELVTDALAAAERNRGTLDGAIMHTDHGSQYTSRAFAEVCRPAEVRQSMSAVGSSADNAAAESFNAAFKTETLKGRMGWPSEREARLDAFRWLTRYNTQRRHSHPAQKSPVAFENTFHLTSTTLDRAA
ncbi:IS3 family transposase [Streptomyces nigra]